jgi:multiple sugar transport system substrate-binding protein
MKHRLSTVALLLTLIALFISACVQPAATTPGTTTGGEAATADGPVRLNFVGWGGPAEIEVFTSLVESFNAANPDIVIEYNPIPDDYVTKLKTMIAGGTPPDIAYIPDGDFSAFVPRGQLVNIQEFVNASTIIDPDGIWDSALLRYRYDSATLSLGAGDLYALPKDIGPTVLFINKDLFEQAGVPLPDLNVPLTWDEIIEIGRQITVDANGRHPGDDGFDINTVEIFGVGDIWFENAVYGNGGRVVSEDGRTFVGDTPETIVAIQFLSDLTHKYQVHPTSQQTASMSMGQMFETGRVAMTTNGRWATTHYRNALDFDWDVLPNPVGPSGQVTAAEDDCTFGGWSGSVGIGIIAGSNGAANPEAAYRFIEFIAGPEGQTQQAALGFQIPNQKDLANNDVFLQPDQRPANSQVFIEAARCALPGPWTQTPLYGQWFDDLWWQGVWPEVVVDGERTAEEAITSRTADFQSRLDEAWQSLEE